MKDCPVKAVLTLMELWLQTPKWLQTSGKGLLLPETGRPYCPGKAEVSEPGKQHVCLSPSPQPKPDPLGLWMGSPRKERTREDWKHFSPKNHQPRWSHSPTWPSWVGQLQGSRIPGLILLSVFVGKPGDSRKHEHINDDVPRHKSNKCPSSSPFRKVLLLFGGWNSQPKLHRGEHFQKNKQNKTQQNTQHPGLTSC